MGNRHSLEYWNRSHRRVKKGSHHISRNKKGVPLFDMSQTLPSIVPFRRRLVGHYIQSEYDDDFDEGMSAYDYGADY